MQQTLSPQAENEITKFHRISLKIQTVIAAGGKWVDEYDWRVLEGISESTAYNMKKSDTTKLFRAKDNDSRKWQIDYKKFLNAYHK